MVQEFYAQKFPVDHIIARQHGGLSTLENLALCCPSCNRYKGPNLAGLDSTSGDIVPLFHPRRDIWRDHFQWRGPRIAGMTSIGRATVTVLNINHPKYVAVRQALISEGVFP